MTDFDPRMYFAAERTMLAWLRTGLTIMAFGFVIAKFGLFLRILALQIPSSSTQFRPYQSGILGIALVSAGTLMIFAAISQHRRFIATLPSNDQPAGYAGGMLLLLSSAFIGLVGIALALYLAGSLE